MFVSVVITVEIMKNKYRHMFQGLTWIRTSYGCGTGWTQSNTSKLLKWSSDSSNRLNKRNLLFNLLLK